MSDSHAYRLSRQFQWEAAHRLCVGYEGKCQQIHGHSWRAEVHVALRPETQLSEAGFVIDFAELKRVQHWIDENWDHATLVDSRDESLLRFLRTDDQKHYVLENRTPSSEHLCRDLMDAATDLVGDERCAVIEVRLSETCTNEARLVRNVGL